VGRPRTRWADEVQRDALRLLGIRGWRRRAENRDGWRRLLREAQGPEGAVASYMEWKKTNIDICRAMEDLRLFIIENI
jgi:hypothetical protein